MLQADYERGTKDSELKRFNANDISDIEAMISREFVDALMPPACSALRVLRGLSSKCRTGHAQSVAQGEK